MRSQINLGEIFGIKIGLHYSWFLIAFLIACSLVADYRVDNPQWSNNLVVALAIATSVLFFMCLLLHELAHSLAAKAHGLPVHEITLFALGGISQLEKDAESASAEFQIAIVGPLTSAVIGLLCLSIVDRLSVNNATLSPLLTMLSWLGYINLGISLFNMITGYPMDGGRVLRAIIWWKTGDLDRATRNASRLGQAIAALFIMAGVVSYFRGGGLGSLWMVFIGWFLLQAARETYAEMIWRRSFDNVKVGDLMIQEFPTVDGHESLQNFVDERLLPTGGRSFLVTEDGSAVGFITPREIKRIARTEWPLARIDTIMRPFKNVHTVAPDSTLLHALEVMAQDDLSQIPMVSQGHLQGALPREELLNYFKTVMELHDPKKDGQ
jgi:Zn-dependent protease